jgi:hypothetical protein
MAVRDDGEQRETTGVGRRNLPWRDTLGHLPAILAVGAVVLYAHLSICYDRFYRGLGVDPADVGLSYSGTLARSVGFVVVNLMFLGLVALEGAWLTRTLRFRPTDRRIRLISTVNAFTLVLAGVYLFLGLLEPYVDAGRATNAVKAGRPVAPVATARIPFPTPPILAIHADPTSIEPSGKPGDSPAVDRLQGRKLLYLGQSGGTVILYDADVDRAAYVPAGSIILHVANCDAKPPPDPACKAIGGS